MSASTTPAETCREFLAALKAGSVTCIEEFLETRADATDDETLEQLLAIDIDYQIDHDRVVSEVRLHERFPKCHQIVIDAFQDAMARRPDARGLFFPDPSKTADMAEMFLQSTNLAAPGSYLALEQELDADPLPPEVRLRIVRGPHAGRELSFLSSASLLAGRADDARLSLPRDEKCSRRHCSFEISPPHCSVMDLRSTNGTLVNGRRVERCTLQDQDTVMIGETKIRVHIQQQTEGSSSGILPPGGTFNAKTDAPSIAGYEVDCPLGNGRFGVVFAGIQKATGRNVAIKLLSNTAVPSYEEIEQFVHEASVSIRLKHKYIVETLDFGMQDITPYLVMERVETIDIVEYLNGISKPRLYREVPALIAMVLGGLASAHSLDIIHRDIKVSNLLFHRTTDRGIRVKISDFGLALKSTASYHSQKAICGTAAYMSPEMITDVKGAGRLSDIYATGVCLYELLCGRRPHEARELRKLLFMIQNEPATPIIDRCPGIPPTLAALVNRSIAKDPRKRYQSAAEMRTDLIAFCRSEFPPVKV